MKNLLAIILFVLPSGFLTAQPFTSYLDTTYNLDGRSDWFLAAARIGGNISVTTWSNASGVADYGIAKFSETGTLISLQINYDTTTYEAPIDIAPIGPNRFALALQYRNLFNGDFQYRTVIMDTNNSIVSSYIHGTDTIFEIPQGLCYRSGKIVVTGAKNNTSSQSIYIVSTDTTGNFLWENELGTTQYNENSYGIVATSDGGYMVTGYRGFGFNKYDWLVIKTDSLGNQEWEKTFGGGGTARHCRFLGGRTVLIWLRDTDKLIFICQIDTL